MHIVRGIILGLIAIGLVVLLPQFLIRRAAPSAATANGDAEIASALSAAQSDDDQRRRDRDRAPQAAPSPLESLIMAQGLPCRGVIGAVPIPGGDGMFWIQCRTASGTARYRVDTRRNLAEPA